MMSSCVLVLAKLCLALFLVVFSSFLGEGKVLEDGCENIVDFVLSFINKLGAYVCKDKFFCLLSLNSAIDWN